MTTNLQSKLGGSRGRVNWIKWHSPKISRFDFLH